MNVILTEEIDFSIAMLNQFVELGIREDKSEVKVILDNLNSFKKFTAQCEDFIKEQEGLK